MNTAMTSFRPYLEWIDCRHDDMCRLVVDWANINSHSDNLQGLEELLANVKPAFRVLKGEMREITMEPRQVINSNGERESRPLGKMLVITKRPEAPIHVLLGIHLDTVYPSTHPFQTVERLANGTFHGPGVADAKGGVVILLKALEAFEQSPFAKAVGWEVFLNPDEEIGSPGSTPFLIECAKRHDVGLLFEPALPGGNLASERQGTGEYTIVVRGRAAHVGRDPQQGRSAVRALAKFILETGDLQDGCNDGRDGVIVNVANIESNGALNVVPDLAIARLGVRMTRPDGQERVKERLDRIVATLNDLDGITVQLDGSMRKPPKVLDDATFSILDSLQSCATALGFTVAWRPTGGASDGNTLAAAGLPTVDSLGARGGAIHSLDEYLEIDSLTERAKLVALYLMKLGTGECPLPRTCLRLTASLAQAGAPHRQERRSE